MKFYHKADFDIVRSCFMVKLFYSNGEIFS